MDVNEEKLSAFGAELMKAAMASHDCFLQPGEDLDLVLAAIMPYATKAIYNSLWNTVIATKMLRETGLIESNPILLLKDGESISEKVSLTWHLPPECTRSSEVESIYKEHQKKILQWRETHSEFRETQIQLNYVPSNGGDATTTYA